MKPWQITSFVKGEGQDFPKMDIKEGYKKFLTDARDRKKFFKMGREVIKRGELEFFGRKRILC